MCVYVCMYTCMYVCIDVCMYVYLCMYMYVNAPASPEKKMSHKAFSEMLELLPVRVTSDIPAGSTIGAAGPPSESSRALPITRFCISMSEPASNDNVTMIYACMYVCMYVRGYLRWRVWTFEGRYQRRLSHYHRQLVPDIRVFMYVCMYVCVHELIWYDIGRHTREASRFSRGWELSRMEVG
jgi:hypothetical protein